MQEEVLKKVACAMSESDLEDIEYLICHIGMLWRRLINARVKAELGLSDLEKRVLCCVARQLGNTQIQIARILDIEPQNLTRVLDQLAARKLIERRENQRDRRAKCLYLTPAAEEIFEKVCLLSKEIQPDVLRGISDKNIRATVQDLNIIRENLFLRLNKIV